MQVKENSSKSLEIATLGSTQVAKRTEPKRFNFTKKSIEKAKPSGNDQRAYYYDTTTRGLALAVSPAGKKVFVLYRKVAGRPERITIGPYPDLTIEKARKRADELNGSIALGGNPAAKRRTIQDEMTLKELFDAYLDRHAKAHKKSWSSDDSMFKTHLANWSHRKISDIRKTDVLTLHHRIGAGKGGHAYAANRVVELLSSMFNKAIEWGWEGENPASRIRAFKERKRDRFLQPEEFPAFWKALIEELNTTARDYFIVSLLTGARRANVQAMRWSEINWPAETWTIPETKSGEPVTVALSPKAIEILERRKDASNGSEWVFPGLGATGHLIEPKAAWQRICKRAGIEDLRIHDLRRTLGSWQAATGASLPVIGKSLGHKSLGATQVYARLNIDPVRIAVNKAVDAMMLAANGPARLNDRMSKDRSRMRSANLQTSKPKKLRSTAIEGP